MDFWFKVDNAHYTLWFKIGYTSTDVLFPYIHTYKPLHVQTLNTWNRHEYTRIQMYICLECKIQY